jgi:hypothetical protein
MKQIEKLLEAVQELNRYYFVIIYIFFFFLVKVVKISYSRHSIFFLAPLNPTTQPYRHSLENPKHYFIAP